MQKSITVFTPTYNRKDSLLLGYRSLLRQTNKNFIWLIIDDGSTDHTDELVKEWQNNKNDFNIKYYYKSNGGLHTAYNKAIELIDTELLVCIDSDDYMPDNAIEIILNYWNIYGSTNYAGIIGLDYYTNGKSIGGDLPNVHSLYLMDLECKFQYHGDTKMVIRTDLLKSVAPQPTYNNEKNFNPIYLILQVGELHPFLILNKNLCFVEYHLEGMSSNIFKQYKNSPNSFAALRKLNLTLQRTTFKFRLKQHIHYVSSCILAKQKNILKESPNKLFTIMVFPLGILLYLYIIWKAK